MNGPIGKARSRPSDAAQAFEASIGKAEMEIHLVWVAKAMEDANLSDADKAYLRPIYGKKRAAIRKAGAK